MPCPQWPEGGGSHWVALGLLLLVTPAPGPSLAFPNDVLAKLARLEKQETDSQHRAHDKNSTAPVLPSSPVLAYQQTGRLPDLTKTLPALAAPHGATSSDTLHKETFRGGDKGREEEEEEVGEDSVYSQLYDSDSDNDIDSDVLRPLPDGYSEITSHTYHHVPSDSLADHGQAGWDVVGNTSDGDAHRHSWHPDHSVSHHPDPFPTDIHGTDPHSAHTEGHSAHMDTQSAHTEGHSAHRETAKGAKPDSVRCAHCEVRAGDRRYRMESIKRQILQKLHLDKPPNLTGVATVPKAIAHLADIQLGDLMQDAPYGGYSHKDNYDDEDDDYHSAPERVFTVAKPMPVHLEPSVPGACYFNMPPEVVTRPVQKASLWFYVRRPSVILSTVIEMRVFRLGPHSKRLHPTRRVIWSQKAYPEKAIGWKRVDVTAMVRRWARHPSSNYGIEIEALNGLENLVVLPGQASESERGYEPLLDIKVMDDHRKRRFKRSEALACTENTTEHRCCRYPLHVSFAEFGWNWVIAPTHVEVGYCSGECRMTLQDETPHSWLSSQVPESGGSCCTPTKTSALPLLYFDQNENVVFQRLQSMKIERCGCA